MRKLSKRLGAAALLFALAACGGGSGGAQKVTLTKAATETRTATLEVQWQAEAGTMSALLQVALTDDGAQICTVSQGGRVHRFAAADGKAARDDFNLNAAEEITAGIGCAGETAAAISADGILHVQHAARGKLWAKDLRTRAFAAPLLAGGKLFALGLDGRLLAYTQRSGRELWRYVSPRRTPLRTPLDSSPVLADGALYIGVNSGVVIALNPANGRVLWENSVALPGGSNAIANILDVTTPAVSRRRVCATAYQGGVSCFTRADGERLWHHALSAQVRAAFGAKGERLFVSEAGGDLYGFRAADGSVLWRTATAMQLSAPLAAGELVLVGGCLRARARLLRGQRQLRRLAGSGRRQRAAPARPAWRRWRRRRQCPRPLAKRAADPPASAQMTAPAAAPAADLANVVIVGRPNVGKSLLFNRLLRQRHALVHGAPGMTLDFLRERLPLGNGRSVWLADTGGVRGEEDEWTPLISAQMQHAAQDADLFLLVVDGRKGLVSGDAELARALRRRHTPWWLLVNKAEGMEAAAALADFHQLGSATALTLSAKHGSGLQTLRQQLAENFPPADVVDLATGAEETAAEENKPPSIAVVGRPNVGKSTFINRLLGDARLAVCERPGTTRDKISCELAHPAGNVVLVDTAGIRRRRATAEREKLGVAATRRALAQADCAILMIDLAAGVTYQDKRIAAQIEEAGCALVVVANKADLLPARRPAAPR